MDFSADGALLASSSSAIGVSEGDRTAEHNTIQVWDVASGENVMTIPPDGVGYIRDVEISPDGKSIAGTTWSASVGGTARVYDMATGAETLRLYAHRDVIPDIEYSPDGKHLATASYDALDQDLGPREGCAGHQLCGLWRAD